MFGLRKLAAPEQLREYDVDEKRIDLFFDIADDSREAFLAWCETLPAVRSCEMHARTITVVFKEYHSGSEKKSAIDKILATVMDLGTRAAVR